MLAAFEHDNDADEVSALLSAHVIVYIRLLFKTILAIPSLLRRFLPPQPPRVTSGEVPGGKQVETEWIDDICSIHICSQAARTYINCGTEKQIFQTQLSGKVLFSRTSGCVVGMESTRRHDNRVLLLNESLWGIPGGMQWQGCLFRTGFMLGRG